jgi:excisionase family DNA binding protein
VSGRPASANGLTRLLGPALVEVLDAHILRLVEEALDRRENEKRWLSVREAAAYLDCSESAVRKRIARGTLPATRFGTKPLVDRRALDAELERGLR